MFPGQGSQSVGMGKDLYRRHATVRATYDEASAVLGYDIAALSFEGPGEELNRTDITQPALLVHSVAVFRLLAERGLRFDVALGHSLGEYSALVAVGALPFAAAVDLVRRRGEAMQAAAAEHPGGMAAVLGLDDEAVTTLCAGMDDVWPANFNSPGQVVVSGSESGLELFESAAGAAGARKVIRLQVGGAFHSPYMLTAAEALRPALDGCAWSPPERRFFSVCSLSYEEVGFPVLLARQVCAPVRFTQAVRALEAEGCETLLEIGPGAVLCGLVRRITPAVKAVKAGDHESLGGLSGEWFS